MSNSMQSIIDDLGAFADLGTEPPVGVEQQGRTVVRLVREGSRMELVIRRDGSIIERYLDTERTHFSFKALLASKNFADLGRWADSQSVQLRGRVALEKLPVSGVSSDSQQKGGVEFLDELLWTTSENPVPSLSVTLINGPAGIGKTSLIRSLAYRRASSYRKLQRPLLLHVESRGRMLQNITDLMAFSLQTLRLNIMYDQVPPLVRCGLITLAIDGFDELGDPNGYDLAWAQMNELLVDSRGEGNILLAGRETFISRDRMVSALKSMDENKDKLNVYTVLPLHPKDARDWLLNAGWGEEDLSSDIVSSLLEVNSYALRPFFLTELSRTGVAAQIRDGFIDDLLSFLIEAMIRREATKFGADLEAATTEEGRMLFVRRLMEETARDLAENQSDAIPADTLSWLAEIVASDMSSENLVGIFKNRAGVIAFLGEDERRGYRRFLHEQVSNYFLAHVTIHAIAKGEIPKYIRRNILGLEFLENFTSVFRKASDITEEMFYNNAVALLESLSDADRARRNLATLLMTAVGVAPPAKPITIKQVSLDEVILSESVINLRLEAVTIGQLYARGADARDVIWNSECFVMSLIADGGTLIADSFPTPSVISLPVGSISSRPKIDEWIHHHLGFPKFDTLADLPQLLEGLAPFQLLARVARYKPFWLKEGDEKGARRILSDPEWPGLKALLLENELLLERTDVPASGRPAVFYHVKNRDSLMELDQSNTNVRKLCAELIIANLHKS